MSDQPLKTRIAATVLNDRGDLLAFSTKGSMQECEENADKTFLSWPRMKELGSKVVQTYLIEAGTKEQMLAAVERIFEPKP